MTFLKKNVPEIPRVLAEFRAFFWKNGPIFLCKSTKIREFCQKF